MGLIIDGSPEITFPRNFWCEAIEQNFKQSKTMSEEKEYRLKEDTGPYKIHHPVFPAVEAYCEDVPMYRIKGNPELFVEACHVEEVPRYYKLGQEFESDGLIRARYKLMYIGNNYAKLLRLDGVAQWNATMYVVTEENGVLINDLDNSGCLSSILKPIN